MSRILTEPTAEETLTEHDAKMFGSPKERLDFYRKEIQYETSILANRTDAYLAALAIANGWRLVSCDRDFERFAGEHVQVRLSLPIGNQRNFVGVIEGVRDGAVALRTEKGEALLPFDDIEKARLVPQF